MGGAIAIISFIFGSIAGGFLAEIGKDLWLKAKEFCKKIVQSQRKGRYIRPTTITVKFVYGDHQIIASLKIINIEKSETMSSLYGMDLVHIFWEKLPVQVSKIIELIDEKPEDLAGIKEIKLELSNKEKKWLITKT